MRNDQGQLFTMIGNIFPEIDTRDLMSLRYINELEVELLAHYLKNHMTCLGEYIDHHYEEVFVRMVDLLNDTSSEENTYCETEEMFVAFAAAFLYEDNNKLWDRADVVLQYFNCNEMVRNAFNKNASSIPELCAEMFIYSFLSDNEENIRNVYSSCIQGKYDESFLEILLDCEPNHFSSSVVHFTPEQEMQEYDQYCDFIKNKIPELYPYKAALHDQVQLRKARRILKEVRDLQKIMLNGIFWKNEKICTDQRVEFDYIYPNGKVGDVLKYILDEYGETFQKDGITWHGRIRREEITLLGLFFVMDSTSISSDERFKNIFLNHIPSIIDKKLTSSVCYGGNRNDYFREINAQIRDYLKVQTKRRSEIYSSLVLQGKTTTKWKSEAQLFALVSSIYSDAIYQYRSDWLGIQSIDIYIPSLSIAIEYQGVQHYKSIEHFGGEQHFLRQKANDERKRQLCKEHSIILLEWPYSRKITKKNFEQLIIDLV